MSYSDAARYIHKRYLHPSEIDDDTWSTVPISHTKSKKKWPKGTMGVVGIKKSTGNEVIQSVLIPRRR